MVVEKPTVRGTVRVAIVFARNFVSGLVQNVEPRWQQSGTTLTDAEMIVQEELQRISPRLEATNHQDALALATE